MVKKNSQEIDFLQRIFHTANEGSLLHQLYFDGVIEEAEFQAGLAFSKLYNLAMRSFGIYNRLHTSCQRWEQLYGVVYDRFSNQKIEVLWRYVSRALDPIYHDGISMREIAFSLIFVPQTRLYSLKDIKKTLLYLQFLWEEIERTPYHFGLYSCKKTKRRKELH